MMERRKEGETQRGRKGHRERNGEGKGGEKVRRREGKSREREDTNQDLRHGAAEIDHASLAKRFQTAPHCVSQAGLEPRSMLKCWD